ncbi:uncharacterized protein FOMMEDRAFT_152762 [Fomitiporia mediterranea MF3/22]|uniref:uncharacterized protein n=1 Tax=Fomitiporia mediterranea (strain MF3/22) TaxID=694068 RepID=UPI0004407372|nr:uncharacterized protein FOMMEDRAFT_152762 [Fomitiporia mediterranea MF3/22]EJD05452.1 hypothetical protein FOMMEDRAFT_152762 [Fomitiporia mediterranea MF3/22]
MADSAHEAQATIVVLVEFVAVIAIIAFLIFLYTQRKIFSGFWHFICQSFRRKPTSPSSKSDGPTQLTSRDLEKGVAAGQPGITMASGSLTRVLAYIQGLPRESDDYFTMHEISITASARSREVTESVRALTERSDEGSEESLESNWIEIIQNFPVPPDSAVLRRMLEGGFSHDLGLELNSGLEQTPAGNSQTQVEEVTSASNVPSQDDDKDKTPVLANDSSRVPPASPPLSSTAIDLTTSSSKLCTWLSHADNATHPPPAP